MNVSFITRRQHSQVVHLTLHRIEATADGCGYGPTGLVWLFDMMDVSMLTERSEGEETDAKIIGPSRRLCRVACCH